MILSKSNCQEGTFNVGNALLQFGQTQIDQVMLIIASVLTICEEDY
jgi:hypothetical protein